MTNFQPAHKHAEKGYAQLRLPQMDDCEREALQGSKPELFNLGNRHKVTCLIQLICLWRLPRSNSSEVYKTPCSPHRQPPDRDL